MTKQSTNYLNSLLLGFAIIGACQDISGEVPGSESTVDGLKEQAVTENPKLLTDAGKDEQPVNEAYLFAYISEHLVDIEGSTYLDIGAYNDSAYLNIGAYNGSFMEIEGMLKRLPKVTRNFTGITVVDGTECALQFLELSQGILISENITRCGSLKNLTLAGEGWRCNHAWTWLDDLEHWNIDYSTAICSDFEAPVYTGFVIPGMPEGFTIPEIRPLPFADGRQTCKKLELDVCPNNCKCKAFINTDGQLETFKVWCGNLNLTDEELLTMSIPRRATWLSLEYNKLRSTENVFKYISHLHSLKRIDLKYNELDEIPNLSEDMFPKLNHLDLYNNKIRKINPKAFESIVSRDGMTVLLHENDFLCDCNAHFFMKVLLQHPEKVQDVTKAFRCTKELGGKSYMVTVRPNECEPTSTSTKFNGLPILIVVLILLNAGFIYIIIDLYRAIKNCHDAGGNKDPKIHVIMKRVKTFYSSVFNNNSTPAETGTPASLVDLREEVPIIRRTRRTSSQDRRSIFRRPDSRITPGLS